MPKPPLLAEEKKLENGLTTTFMVLQMQEILTAALTAEAQALVDYNKALAQLAFAEGEHHGKTTPEAAGQMTGTPEWKTSGKLSTKTVLPHTAALNCSASLQARHGPG